MIKEKISLGTANFSKGYGIRESKGLSSLNINKILKVLKKNNLRYIDTGISYKSVGKKLGEQNLNNFFIYSKVPKLPIKCKNIKKWLDKIIKKSLDDLKIENYEGIFFHHPEDLLKKNGSELYEHLLDLKRKGIVKKVGISIYSYFTLEKILRKYQFDIVQIPFNIFDRRLIFDNYLNKIKKKKIEIHIRSIFLQGILLKDFTKISKYFYKWKKIFLRWENWCKLSNTSKLQSCLNFALNYKKIDRVIIGVTHEAQLIQILNCMKKISKQYPKNIFSQDSQLIDPRKWKKI